MTRTPPCRSSVVLVAESWSINVLINQSAVCAMHTSSFVISGDIPHLSQTMQKGDKMFTSIEKRKNTILSQTSKSRNPPLYTSFLCIFGFGELKRRVVKQVRNYEDKKTDFSSSTDAGSTRVSCGLLFSNSTRRILVLPLLCMCVHAVLNQTLWYVYAAWLQTQLKICSLLNAYFLMPMSRMCGVEPSASWVSILHHGKWTLFFSEIKKVWCGASQVDSLWSRWRIHQSRHLSLHLPAQQVISFAHANCKEVSQVLFLSKNSVCELGRDPPNHTRANKCSMQISKETTRVL